MWDGFWRQSLAMKAAIIIACLIAAGVVASAVTGDDPSDGGAASDERRAPASEQTIEHKLAIVDSGDPVNAGDPVVSDYGRVLDDLQTKCSDSRERLADYALTTEERLLDRGIEESALVILRSVNRSLPDGSVGQPCAEVFATYLTLRLN